jgi:hypothetical protein
MGSRIWECDLCGEEYPASLGGCPWCEEPKRTEHPLVEPPYGQIFEDDE